jgi:hypothetical protein
MQTGVDDFKAMVTESTGDGLRATVMAIEARLGYNNSVGALHRKKTLRRHGISALTRHNVGVPLPRPQSTLARALVPVIAGILGFGLMFLATWGVAAFISRNPSDTIRVGTSIFEVGPVKSLATQVDEGGPLFFPDLKSPEGTRSIILDHAGDDPALGWQVYMGYPADRDATCLVTQIQNTRTFTDCDSRTLGVEDLALPEGIRPVVENRATLFIDLRGNSTQSNS